MYPLLECECLMLHCSYSKRASGVDSAFGLLLGRRPQNLQRPSDSHFTNIDIFHLTNIVDVFREPTRSSLVTTGGICKNGTRNWMSLVIHDGDQVRVWLENRSVSWMIHACSLNTVDETPPARIGADPGRLSCTISRCDIIAVPTSEIDFLLTCIPTLSSRKTCACRSLSHSVLHGL